MYNVNTCIEINVSTTCTMYVHILHNYNEHSTYVYSIYTYVPSTLYFFLLRHLAISLYSHHNNTDTPHVDIPSMIIETLIYLSSSEKECTYTQVHT